MGYCSSMIKIGIAGGAGYTAGELIRILVNHPQAEIKYIQSESHAGELVSKVHGDLLYLPLTFSAIDFSAIDVLFMCMGHGCLLYTSRLMKDGKNMYIENGKLTDNALKAIAGILNIASSLTAFGNTNPTSYFRLVPHQEAPTNICWGDRNRSVLVRVPLGWTEGADKMITDANPLEKPAHSLDPGIKMCIRDRYSPQKTK